MPAAPPASAKAKRAKSATDGEAAKPAKPTKPVELGTVLAPSGVLGIFDIGLVGFLPREALEPVIVKIDAPADRELPVIATPIAAGRWQGAWDHVAIAIGRGEIAKSRKIGEVAVDLGHVACMDVAALDAWRHEDALDGLADVVFDGADAAAAARIIGAKRLRDGHGWTDLPLADAERRFDDVLRKKSANDWRVAAELRPHSHHHRALDGIGRSASRATTLELAGGKLVVFATGWGQGVYPIYADRDGDERVVRVRIQLAPPA